MTRILSPTCGICDKFIGDQTECQYLVLWRIVELGVVALTVPVVQEVVVHKVPAPALGVGAEKRHVSVALGRRLLGCDPYNRHRP